MNSNESDAPVSWRTLLLIGSLIIGIATLFVLGTSFVNWRLNVHENNPHPGTALQSDLAKAELRVEKRLDAIFATQVQLVTDMARIKEKLGVP